MTDAPKPVKVRPPVDGKCPVCGADVIGGFGLAGGGYGAYWACDTDDCSYFYKEQEKE